MKTSNLRTGTPFRKALLYITILLGGLTLSSYKSLACTASFTYSAGINGHYTFTSTSSGFSGAFFYYWNPGDGSGWQYGSTIFSHIYTANGTYYARLYVSDSTCSDTSAIDTIIVSNITTPCTLSAGFNYSVGANGVVTFTSTSTGTSTNTFYYWSPGDSGQRVQGTANYMHQYSYVGYYSVWLIVEDTGSAYCADSVQEYVFVNTADSTYCHIHCSFTYTVGVNGQVSFTSTSTGVNPGDGWFWNPGDGSGDGYTANTYSHTYANDGTYTVTLNISRDSVGGCSDSVALPITVTGACNLVANFTWTYDSAGQVLFTSTSTGTGAGTVYNWSFGDGTPALIGDDTATHAFSFIGSYNVTLSDSTAGGCVASVTKTIYIYNKDSLEARFVYASDSLLTGQYSFTSTSLGTNANTYYKWIWGDATPSDSGLGMTTQQHTYTSNGPYSATLTIWYTILPLGALNHMSPVRYDESSYTLIINVNTITGIQSITGKGQTYTIYPNPNDGSFNIAVNGLPNEKNAEIRISNMVGQVIYQSNTAVKGGNTLSNINLPDAANGIYLLQIITPGNTYTSRIAIQK